MQNIDKLRRKISKRPKKVTELARQNRILLKETALMHYNLGVFYTQRNEFPRAISEFIKAVELNPDDPDAQFNLGYIYAEHLEKRKQAVKYFQNYLRLVGGLEGVNEKDINWVRRYLLIWETYDRTR